MGFFTARTHREQKFGKRVTICLRAKRCRNSDQKAVEIRLGRMIVASMGWEVNARLELLWGHGADFGMVCIRKSATNAGCRLLARDGKNSALLISTNRIPRHDITDEHHGVWRLRLDKPINAVEVKPSHLPEGRLGIPIPSDWFEQIKAPRRFSVVG